MTTANHDDLQRSLGRVEGNQSAMEARMDRFEKLMSDGFKTVEDALTDIDKRLASIESKESERKGAFSFGQWIVGVIGAGLALIVNHFWR